jgi:D-threo-aldose 1-dehydrogenase
MSTAASRFGPVVQGCAALAGLYAPVSDDTAKEALARCWELGVRAFDTAPHYGVGLSEERLGRFLRQRPRGEFVVSTKVGRLLIDDPQAPEHGEGFAGTPRRRRIRDYTADGVRRSLDASMERLGLDRIDLVLIHDPEDHMEEALQQAAPALSRLRDSGVIDGYGVGTNHCEVALRFATETDSDHVLIAGRYTLLDRRAEQLLLPTCAERGVAVLAAGVLNSGLLADPSPGARFDYSEASPELLDAAARMERTCLSSGVSLRAAALQFAARHPAVVGVVIGAETAPLVQDCLIQRAVPIPPALWAELDALAPDQALLRSR